MFDPNAFLDTTVDSANDTVVIPVPVGEYIGVIDKVDARQWTKKDDPTVTGVALDIIWDIDDAALKELLGREKVTVKQGLMLDFNEAGQLDMGKGKNIGLGRLREAVGLNIPGRAFSFNQLPGQVARISVSHRPDKNDTSIVYAEVKAVAKP